MENKELFYTLLELASKEKYPDIQICSIGPNIYFPHSNRETVELSSVDTIYKIVRDIVDDWF